LKEKEGELAPLRKSTHNREEALLLFSEIPPEREIGFFLQRKKEDFSP